MSNLLTHSRQASFKSCRKKHWFEYEAGIRKETDAKALRMGSAYHDGLEAIGKGKGLAAACDAIRANYEHCPDQFEEHDWRIEEETVIRLLCGYVWRWGEYPLKHLATEQSFRLPLVNPETGRASRTFELAGKIDGIVELEDGRLAVLEHKLFSEDLGDGSDLWPRLRIDQQLSLYVYAARQLGYPVDTCLYNVTRKPTIKPTAIPVLDELGAKIVLDQHGIRMKTAANKWRQTADKEKGWELQTREMTVGEWGEKLSDDIAKRHDFYYARREVPRLDGDLEEYTAELWDIAATIRTARNDGQWFKTVTKDCRFCAFFHLCSEGWTPSDSLPEGFVRVNDVHPELDLEKVEDEHESTTATTREEITTGQQ